VPSDYGTIQSAIDAAGVGDTVQVAAGTYIEDITLKSGVIVQGAGAAVTTIFGTGTKSVVTAINVDSISKIDGFTITNGGGIPQIVGGGIYLKSSSPTVSNNIITGNNIIPAYNPGSGISCWSSSSPTITNNTITGNRGGIGGGIYVNQSSPTISHNNITGNVTGGGSGGIEIRGLSSPIIDSNNISGNSGPNPSPEIELWDSDTIPFGKPPALIINNKIKGRLGLLNYQSSSTLINNTFIGTGSVDSIGFQCMSPIRFPSTIIFTNNILWGFANNYKNICAPDSSISVTYSCIGAPFLGGTNIADDPKFVDAAGGDYHLRPDSPCIDMGSNAAVPSWLTTDLDGNPRIGNGTVDIGAYESVSVPGATPIGENVPVTPADPNPAVPGTSVKMTFSEVTLAGITSVASTQSGTPPPTGFSLGDPPVYFDITTTATVVPPITVCINYTGISFVDESTLRLYHQTPVGGWEDVTISLDQDKKIICGVSSSLSPFAILKATYQFVGFFPPVQTGPAEVNLVKAGSAIPLKWQLLDKRGVVISDLSAVTGIRYQQKQCSDSTLLYDLVLADSTGNSGLKISGNQYHYNWKTAKNMAKKCYRLNVELFRFDVHSADFQMW
jgi:parallel beta-helix repeat protein